MAEDNLNTPQPPQTEEDYAALFLLEHIKGYSAYEIGRKYYCSTADVRRLIKQSLKKVEIDSKKKLIRQEVVKLDALEAVAMRSALNDKGIHDSRATKSVLAVAARRARLLGLDRPAKMELSGADGEPLQQTLFYIPSNGRDGMPPLVEDPNAEGG